jgi:predicted transport protein
MNLSSGVKKEFKKKYVAYKLDTNFVDIVFQEKRLRISVNMKFADVKDPKGICKDITRVGR